MQHGCKNEHAAEAETSPSSHWLDRMGIGVSITCAIHCVAAALLAAAPAFAASAAPDLGAQFEWAEGALLWMALGIGAFALVPAYLRQRRPMPLALFSAGLVLLVGSRLVDASGFEIAGTVLGVACVASAHFLNLRARPHSH